MNKLPVTNEQTDIGLVTHVTLNEHNYVSPQGLEQLMLTAVAAVIPGRSPSNTVYIPT